jgi:hypothetical protein
MAGASIQDNAQSLVLDVATVEKVHHFINHQPIPRMQTWAGESVAVFREGLLP